MQNNVPVSIWIIRLREQELEMIRLLKTFISEISWLKLSIYTVMPANEVEHNLFYEIGRLLKASFPKKKVMEVKLIRSRSYSTGAVCISNVVLTRDITHKF